MGILVQETQVIYKSDGATDLTLDLFIPEDTLSPVVRRAAIVFFHGGRFTQGHPAQFYPHCRYLASRGMVTASAKYRLLGKTATSVSDCLNDSRDAIRWLRGHSHDFAIDPTSIIAGGGSAGANLVANAAMSRCEEDVEDAINSRPDVLVLFSPAVVRPNDTNDLIDEQLYTNLVAKPNIAPMLLLHGAEDEFFSVGSMKKFSEQMRAVGNRCDLQLFSGGKHGFFNYGKEDNFAFYETLLATDKFLRELGILEGSPTLVYEAVDTLRHENDWQQ